MVQSNDFIKLPYTPDLTEAGIAYACRSLPYTYDRMGGSPVERMRRIVAGKAVELAFRRLLAAESVPHDNLGATPFTDPDRYDIAIGGRRCDIKSFQIFSKARIRRLRRDPSLLLAAQALVPEEQSAASLLDDEDLYVFAFLTALVTARPGDLQRAQDAGQPLYLIHAMPGNWALHKPWQALGRLALKAESSQEGWIELGGQSAEHGFLSETLELPPRRRLQARQEFYSLAYLHTRQLPDARLGVHSPVLGETHLADPASWGNIWVYGMQILLVGYITRGEFRQNALRLPAGSRVFQYSSTQTPNLALPVIQLHPLRPLLERAKNQPG